MSPKTEEEGWREDPDGTNRLAESLADEGQPLAFCSAPYLDYDASRFHPVKSVGGGWGRIERRNGLFWSNLHIFSLFRGGYMLEKPQVPAAQYVRMSTEDQQYSIANQEAAIQTYAASHSQMW